jgi:hypothetical protein
MYKSHRNTGRNPASHPSTFRPVSSDLYRERLARHIALNNRPPGCSDISRAELIPRLRTCSPNILDTISWKHEHCQEVIAVLSFAIEIRRNDFSPGQRDLLPFPLPPPLLISKCMFLGTLYEKIR